MLRTGLQKQAPVVIPGLPRTRFHSSKSYHTFALKCPQMRSLWVSLLQEVVQAEVEGLLYSNFSLQSRFVHTASGNLIALNWEPWGHDVVWVSNWQVLQFSGDGRFDQKPTPERQLSFLFFPYQKRVWPAPSSMREPCFAKHTSLKAVISLSSQASFLATSAERHWKWSSESCWVRMFQHATLGLLSSSFFHRFSYCLEEMPVDCG